MATASSTLCFWSCRFFKSASKSDSRSKMFLVEKEAKDADVLMEETVKGSFVSRAHIRLSIWSAGMEVKGSIPMIRSWCVAKGVKIAAAFWKQSSNCSWAGVLNGLQTSDGFRDTMSALIGIIRWNGHLMLRPHSDFSLTGNAPFTFRFCSPGFFIGWASVIVRRVVFIHGFIVFVAVSSSFSAFLLVFLVIIFLFACRVRSARHKLHDSFLFLRFVITDDLDVGSWSMLSQWMPLIKCCTYWTRTNCVLFQQLLKGNFYTEACRIQWSSGATRGAVQRVWMNLSLWSSGEVIHSSIVWWCKLLADQDVIF